MHGRHQVGVRSEAVAGDEPGGAQHAQRVVRERHLRLERRAQHSRRQIGHPAVRIDQLDVGQPQRHGVDGEVPPGQVLGDVVGVDDVRLARILAVGLGPVGGDLEDRVAQRAPIVPKACPGSTPSRPAGEQRMLCSAGRRWEVEVAPGGGAPEHQVAAMPRLGRLSFPPAVNVGERPHVVEDRLQPSGITVAG